MGSTKKIIKKSPKFIKKIYYNIVPFRFRYGRSYNDFLKLIKDSKTWSYDQAKEYQLQTLRSLLGYCQLFVPYYNELFSDSGFDPNIKDLSDMKNLPCLTKQLIKSNFKRLRSVGYSAKTYDMHTSGTTGERLHILGTDNLFKIEAAFITNAYNDHGAKLYEDHSIWIRRYSPNEGDPIYFDDLELNRSYMSAFDLNDKTIFDYVKYINQKQSKILVSYPSTIYYLAFLCEKYDLRLKHIKYIHGASEVCLKGWSQKIKDVFGIPIKMHYGQVEKVSFAHQDMRDDCYKENLIYGYNEFDDDNSIIGTGFYNHAMPLIKYKTNDIAEKTSAWIEHDGAYPKTIRNIQGRDGDMLITDRGALVPAVNFYSFMSKIKFVDFFKIEQRKRDKKVLFYIVTNGDYNKDSKLKLTVEMRNRLGEVPLEIIEVDKIDREKSGKFKAVRVYD